MARTINLGFMVTASLLGSLALSSGCSKKEEAKPADDSDGLGKSCDVDDAESCEEGFS